MKKIKAKVFARNLFDAMQKHTSLNTAKERFEAVRKSIFKIEDILEPSLLGFKNVELQTRYKEDLAKLGATPEEFPPTTWARQRSKGEHADILRKTLGNNYAGVMRFIEQGKGSKKKVIVRTNTHTVYDEFVVTFGPYDDIDIKGHGYALEKDHLIEKRFFLNLPHIEASGGQQMFHRGYAAVVPKTHDIADQLGGRKMVLYVHDDKSEALRGLLPHGGEHLYKPQDIWDAHVYYYTNLGIDESIRDVLIDNLEQDMKSYVEFLSTKNNPAKFIARNNPQLPALSPHRFKDPFWWTKSL